MWGGAEGARIINLFTQEASYDHGAKPGKATVEHVNHALRELHKFMETEKFTSLALPCLATGVGGLDWEEVSPLINKHLDSLNVPIYVYVSYQKGIAAKEPG
jgi:O-acetyl-ADP-ribose deacetylase (regulator of RNase III)